jgi:hypothetical protein
MRNGSVSTEASDVTDIVTHAPNLNGPALDVGVPPAADSTDNAGGLEHYFDFNPNALLEWFEMGVTDYNNWAAPTPSPFDFRFPTSQFESIASDEDKWHISNSAFIGCLDSVKKHKGSSSTLDLEVPFKAALWGWDNVGPEAQHPVWNALRQVDQRVFGSWKSKSQRIALMFVCQTLIQYRENPTKENLERVPTWFRPRYVFASWQPHVGS